MNASPTPLTPGLASLPDGPRLVVERSLHILASTESFEDRIAYAHDLVLTLQGYAFAAIISPEQHAIALRRLRAVLQGDLGAITTTDNNTVFDLGGAP